MKKPLIILAIGAAMLVIGALVFWLALSAPTVTGPAAMRVVWDIWMLAGLFLIGLSVGLIISKLFKRK